MNIKILLVDEFSIMRQGLRMLFKGEVDLEVVGEASEGHTSLALSRKLSPDVVIMNISMPDLKDIEAIQQIIRQFSHIKVVILSAHPDAIVAARMLKCGASAYLRKDCSFKELVDAIHTVVEGKIYLSSTMSSVVVNNYLQRLSKTETSELKLLTAREYEILKLIAEGNSTKEIALKLNISRKTVESHRRQIMNKLDIHSVAGLTRYAIRTGIIFLG